MRKIIIILTFLQFSFNLFSQLSTYQQLVVDESIDFVDTLINRFVEQPQNIEGVYLRLPIRKWWEIIYKPVLPGNYNLELKYYSDNVFLRFGNGDSVNINNINSENELILKDYNGNKIIACIPDTHIVRNLVDTITTIIVDSALNVNYLDITNASKFLDDLITTRLKLNAVSISGIYSIYANEIWNIYIGSIVTKNVSKIEDIGAGCNTAPDDLYGNQDFKEYVSGLMGIFSLAKKVNTGSSINFSDEDDFYSAIFNEVSLDIFGNISGLPTDPVSAAQQIITDFVVYFVNSIGVGLDNAEELMQSISDPVISGTHYANVISLNSPPPPNGSFGDIKVHHFFNLPLENGEEVPGYYDYRHDTTSPMQIKWLDADPLGDSLNLISFIVRNFGTTQNAAYSIYKPHIKLSFYDNAGNIIAKRFISSSEASIPSLVSHPLFSWVRIDLGIFIPQSLLDNNCYAKVELYRRDNFINNNEEFIGEYIFYFNSGSGIQIIPPQQPNGLNLIFVNDTAKLTWNENPETNIIQYNIYRDNTDNFIPSTSNFLTSTVDTFYNDVNLLSGNDYYYRITAENNNNIESTPSVCKHLLISGPIANFLADTTSGIAPLTVSFTNLSQSNDSIISYEWDFNNDNIIDSTTQNPSYTYTSPGYYSVRLKVTDSTYSSSVIKNDYIKVFSDTAGLASIFVSKSSVEIMEKFNASIYASNISNVKTITGEIHFNPEIVQVDSITEGTSLSENGTIATEFFKTIDNSNGIITFAVNRLNSIGLNISSYQDIVNLYFRGQAFGNTNIDIFNFEYTTPDSITDFCITNSREIHVIDENRLVNLYFDPYDIDINYLDTFEVNLYIHDVINMYGLATDIDFDPHKLKCINIYEGDFLNANNTENTFFNYDIDNNKGKIITGITRQTTNEMGINGSDEKLLTLKFVSIGTGNTSISCSNAGVILPNGINIYNTFTSTCDITSSLIDEYSKIRFSPDSSTYDLGDIISIFITVENITDLYSFAADVNYNPEILEFITANEGNFLNNNGQTSTSLIFDNDTTTGTIIIGLTRLGDTLNTASTILPDTLLELKFRTLSLDTDTLFFTNEGLITYNDQIDNHINKFDGIVIVQQPTLIEEYPKIRFTPDSSIYNLNDTISIYVTIEEVTDLYSFAADVNYNPGMLEFITANEGNFLNDNGQESTSFMFNDNSSTGTIIIGLTRLGDTLNTASTVLPDTLLELKFRTLSLGTDTLYFTNEGLITYNNQINYNISKYNGIVVIKQIPILTPSDTFSICLNDTLFPNFTIIGGVSPFTYEWYPSTGVSDVNILNPSFSPVASITYYLQITDGNSDTFTDSIFILVNPLPNIFLGNDTTITTNDSIILNTGNIYESYNWSNGSTDSVITVYGLMGTGMYNYSVTVTDVNGCENSDTIVITIDPYTNINNNNFENNISIYPNPTSNIVNIAFSKKYKNINITLYNSIGEVLFNKQYHNTNKEQINLNDLSKGIYFIKIENNTINLFEKIILN